MNYLENQFNPENHSNPNSNLYSIPSVPLSSLVHNLVSAAVYLSPAR